MKLFQTFCIAILIVSTIGCEHSVSPTTENSAVGSFEGEYGFTLDGKVYDSGTPFLNEANASLRPLSSYGPNGVQLSLNLYFELGDGTYGSVQLLVPCRNATPQTIPISYYQDTSASASLIYDSVAWTSYQSLAGGTLTITKFDTIDNLVSGTFRFSASETSPANPKNIVPVTAGYFNDIPLGLGAYRQGSVTALVDGTAFSSENEGRERLYSTFAQGRLNLFANGPGNAEIIMQGIPPVADSYFVQGPQTIIDTSLSITYWASAPNYFKISTEDSGSSGEVIITSCDFANRRFSGSFQFSGTDTLGNSVIISSGKIDSVQWEP
ncbi:MAG TPA: hypothetical protein VGM92_04605 [Candidatus Kapabacteria bacterium]|jgi:hypothetical protein